LKYLASTILGLNGKFYCKKLLYWGLIILQMNKSSFRCMVANEVAAREDLLELGLVLKESAEISHVLLSCANIKAKEEFARGRAFVARISFNGRRSFSF
jgi:hypothetical protein